MKATLLIAGLLLTGLAARADIQWTWTNAGTGTEQGTLITDGDLAGEEVPAGSYTVLDFSVTASLYGAPLGSVSGGEWFIGMPDIGFEWDGAAPTEFWRLNGTYTNGFGLWVVDGSAPNYPDYIAMGIDFFKVENYEHEVEFLEEGATPILVPNSTPTASRSLGEFKVLY